MKEQNLYNYCRWGNTEEVKRILAEDSSIDIMYNDGILFRVAISNQNVEMARCLLEYYDDTKHKNDENIAAIINEAIEESDEIAENEEMKFLLDKYLREKSSCSEQGLYSLVHDTPSLVEIMSIDTSNIAEHNQEYLSFMEKISQEDLYDVSMSMFVKNFGIMANNHLHGRYVAEFKTLVMHLLKGNPVNKVYDLLNHLKEDEVLYKVPSMSTLYRWDKEKYCAQENPTLTYLKSLPPMAESEKFDFINTSDTAKMLQAQQFDLDHKEELRQNTLVSQGSMLPNTQLDQNLIKDLNLQFAKLALHEDKETQCDFGKLSNKDYIHDHSTRSNTPPVQDLADNDNSKQNQTAIDDTQHQENTDIHREVVGRDAHHNNE